MCLILLVSVGIFFGAEVIPFDSTIVEVRCKRIAIIGGGVSGLTTAWALTQTKAVDFEVTVYEAAGRYGGSARTSPPYKGNTVELGVLGFHEKYYNFLALSRRLNTTTLQDARGIAGNVADRNGDLVTMYNMYHATSAAVEPRGKAMHDHITDELRRLNDEVRLAVETMTEKELMTTTVGDFMAARHFSPHFVSHYFYGCLQSFVTVSLNLLDTSLAVLVQFVEMGAFLNVGTGPFVIATDGNSAYIEKLRREVVNGGATLHGNTRVTAVRFDEHGGGGRKPVKLLVNSTWVEYDSVVFAVQRRDALSVLTSPQSTTLPAPKLYRTALGAEGTAGATTYGTFNAVAHTDTTFLAARLRDDSCRNVDGIAFNAFVLNETLTNFLSRPASYHDPKLVGHVSSSRADSVKEPCLAEYKLPYTMYYGDEYVNRGGPLPAVSKQIDNVTWLQPVHDVPFATAARTLHALQGERGLWFAGAEATGYNTHEHAVTAGLVIAGELGAAYPFAGEARARGAFLRQRNWLLYGFNPAVPDTTRRGGRKCPRCP
jgi:predicted NAD/FAD-binding protein